jgi:hypothetical protein
MEKLFVQKILKKYDVQYFRCTECRLVQTEKPYWLTEAYASAINETDVGYVGRNLLMARITYVLFRVLFKKQDAFLDYAGGYGLFARLMHDYGLRFYWVDPYVKGIFAEGLEHTDQKISALTCFECFEHFENPTLELEKLTRYSKTILFSTKLISEESIPPVQTWGYYGFDHGQHITLYTYTSLQKLAHAHNLRLYSDRKNIHLLTTKKIPQWWFTTLLLMQKCKMDTVLRFFL